MRDRPALFRLGVLRGVGLRPGGGVLVNDSGLRGLVHGGTVRDGCCLGSGGVAGLDRGCQLGVQRLQAGLDALVANGEALRFTGGFDGRFGVGHDEV